MAKLRAKIDTGEISIDVHFEDEEYFCNVFGHFREDFLEALDASEKDHQEARITERHTLLDILEM